MSYYTPNMHTIINGIKLNKLSRVALPLPTYLDAVEDEKIWSYHKGLEISQTEPLQSEMLVVT